MMYFPLAVALIGSTLVEPVQVRELVCRGKPGIDLRVSGRPSPADPALVRMTLRYDRPAAPPGAAYEKLTAGACTWNPYGFAGVPTEPGVVHFDISPHAQDWFGTTTRQLDTTYLAGAFFPDTISLPRYLSRSELYYVFYVEDATGIAVSFGGFRNPTPTPRFVTITGTAPVAGSPPPASSGGSGVAGPRTSNASKKAAVSTLTRLSFRGVDRRMDGFTVRFRARPGASATVAYSTSAAVSTPSGWYFPGSAVQGSGAVSRGGFAAEVSESRRGSLFSDYSGSTRLPVQRGTAYNFIITVQGADGPVEQYVGKLTSMRMDVTYAITDFNVTKKSFDQQAETDVDLYCEVAGSFRRCDGRNVSGRIGLLAWARPTFGRREGEPSWTAVSGKNSGIGRLIFDTNTFRIDRPVRAFTVKSLEGDVEFEAHGELRISRY